MTQSTPDDDDTVDVTPELLAEIRAAAALKIDSQPTIEDHDDHTTYDIHGEVSKEARSSAAATRSTEVEQPSLDDDETVDVAPEVLDEARHLAFLKSNDVGQGRVVRETEQARLSALPPPPERPAQVPSVERAGIGETWRAPARLRSETHQRPEEIAASRPLQRRVSARVAAVAIALAVVVSFGLAAFVFGGDDGATSDQLPPDDLEQNEPSVGG